MASRALRRSSIGVADQPGKAFLAAATAWSSWAFEARGHSASTSSFAGFSTDMVESPSTSWPSMRSLYWPMGSSRSL